MVIGASQGVGLAVCKKLLAEGYKVYGTIRSPCPEAEESGISLIKNFDVAKSDPAILSKELQGKPLDVLVVSAGIQTTDNLENVTIEGIRKQMDVNAYGPLFIVQALRSHLKAGSHVALIASKMGSITNTELTGGLLYGYRMSKVALNIAGTTMALELRDAKVTVTLIHPGVVFTNMVRTLREGRGVAPDKLKDNTITPDQSADGIWNIISKTTLEQSGQFWGADTGKNIDW